MLESRITHRRRTCTSAEALSHLKKKKMYEQQFNQLDGQILNLDQTIFALEK